jgi:hypothetical protein
MTVTVTDTREPALASAPKPKFRADEIRTLAASAKA